MKVAMNNSVYFFIGCLKQKYANKEISGNVE